MIGRGKKGTGSPSRGQEWQQGRSNDRIRRFWLLTPERDWRSIRTEPHFLPARRRRFFQFSSFVSVHNAGFCTKSKIHSWHPSQMFKQTLPSIKQRVCQLHLETVFHETLLKSIGYKLKMPDRFIKLRQSAKTHAPEWAKSHKKLGRLLSGPWVWYAPRLRSRTSDGVAPSPWYTMHIPFLRIHRPIH